VSAGAGKDRVQSYDLSDLDESSPKWKLWERLKDFADVRHTEETDRVSKLAEVEKRVHAKRTQYDYDIRPLLILGSVDEHQQVIDFLADVDEDNLPPMLLRVVYGAKYAVSDQGVEV
jgi:hypothetical protein